jgi:hypothetical protein
LIEVKVYWGGIYQKEGGDRIDMFEICRRNAFKPYYKGKRIVAIFSLGPLNNIILKVLNDILE